MTHEPPEPATGSGPGAERAALVELAHAVEPGDAAAGRRLGQVGAVELLDRIRRGSSGLRHEEGLAARLSGITVERAVDRAAACGAGIVTRAETSAHRLVERLKVATNEAVDAASFEILVLVFGAISLLFFLEFRS